jgi:hypothetical protein
MNDEIELSATEVVEVTDEMLRAAGAVPELRRDTLEQFPSLAPPVLEPSPEAVPTAPRPPPRPTRDPEVFRITLETRAALLPLPPPGASPTRELPAPELTDEELSALRSDRRLAVGLGSVVAVVFALAVWSLVPASAPEPSFSSRRPALKMYPPRVKPKVEPAPAPPPRSPWSLDPASSTLDFFASSAGQLVLDPTHRYRLRVVKGAHATVLVRARSSGEAWGAVFPLSDGPALKLAGASEVRLHCEPRGRFTADDVVELELADLALKRQQRLSLSVLRQCFQLSGFAARPVSGPLRLFLPPQPAQDKVRVAWQLQRGDGTWEAGTVAAGQSVSLETGEVRLALLSHTMSFDAPKTPVTLEALPPEGEVSGLSRAEPVLTWEGRGAAAQAPKPAPRAPARSPVPEAWPPEVELER